MDEASNHDQWPRLGSLRDRIGWVIAARLCPRWTRCRLVHCAGRL